MRNAVGAALKSGANAQNNTSGHDTLAATKLFSNQQRDDRTKETSLDPLARIEHQALFLYSQFHRWQRWRESWLSACPGYTYLKYSHCSLQRRTAMTSLCRVDLRKLRNESISRQQSRHHALVISEADGKSK